MIGGIRHLPIEGVVAGIEQVSRTAREADWELTLALAYAHRVMSPPLSLRALSAASGLSPSTIRARVHAPGVMESLHAVLDGSPGSGEIASADAVEVHGGEPQ